MNVSVYMNIFERLNYLNFHFLVCLLLCFYMYMYVFMFIFMCVCVMYSCTSTCSVVSLSLRRPICLSICLSVYLPVCKPYLIYLPVCCEVVLTSVSSYRFSISPYATLPDYLPVLSASFICQSVSFAACSVSFL